VAALRYSAKGMRLRVVRDRFLTRAVAAILSLLVCGTALDWGHAGGDDRDCDIVVVQHDHNAHRISTAPVNSPTDDHCYICHSLRLLHHAVASRYERVAVALQAIRHFDGDVLVRRDGSQVGVASRAPPSVRL
jgi:hypothetical protein